MHLMSCGKVGCLRLNPCIVTEDVSASGGSILAKMKDGVRGGRGLGPVARAEETRWDFKHTASI